MTEPFAGWPKHTFAWLGELEANNNKPWFTENRGPYDEINASSKAFVVELTERLAASGINGEGKVWRIHRDQRFSKGEPYKTTHDLGLFDEMGALHGLRIEPHGVTIAYGQQVMGKQQLADFRETIVDPTAAKALATAIGKVEKKGFSLNEPDLKRPLKDLPDDHPHPNLSRHKAFFMTKFIDGSPSWMFSAKAVDRVVKELDATAPLRDWLDG